ncbi:MAG: dihydrolipoamide acetyltransferase family protein [Anaerolineales bacterium]|jgi:2-oxoglutarate dehydrogenase E2 component (dihydrolipoamide succinyltransferase)|nr:dihydrolipoamide acetyltransferase family protein [Anaerolineales bacterium]
MPTKVFVPRLGEGVEEVTITKWLKAVGDPVSELEALLEVNTDKVDTEIPAPAAGVLLEILLAEGANAKVGDVLAVIGQAEESVESEALNVESSNPSAAPQRTSPPPTLPPGFASQGKPSNLQPSTSKDLGFISPVVARIAAENGIDLSQVRGTGLNGRITKNDMLQFIENGKTENSNRAASGRQPTLTPVLSAAAGPDSSSETLIPHTAIRRAIAKHMLESKQTSPHVLTVMEADLSRVLAHRAANKDVFARDGINLTLTAYFMQAIVAGLKAYPQVNASWSEAGLLLHKAIHLGMATSLGEDGLIVPVVKNAEALSLLGMARAVNDLAGRARARKLQPDEVRGGTFTLTNHGISGSLFAFPVINQPQAGILGIGAIQKRVIVVSDEQGRDSIAIRPLVYLSFVFDHRILDGASADWFLAKVKETLEKWA